MPRLREPDPACPSCRGRGLVEAAGELTMCCCVNPSPKTRPAGPPRKLGRPRASDYVLVGCGTVAHIPNEDGAATLCGVTKRLGRAEHRTDWTEICRDCKQIRKKLGR